MWLRNGTFAADDAKPYVAVAVDPEPITQP